MTRSTPVTPRVSDGATEHLLFKTEPDVGYIRYLHIPLLPGNRLFFAVFHRVVISNLLLWKADLIFLCRAPHQPSEQCVGKSRAQAPKVRHLSLLLL